MDESQFKDKVHAFLKDNLPQYIVTRGENLLYKLIIDPQGKLQPVNYANPQRGQLAFQTDILIKNHKVPLVVIEIKLGGFSTHDILTYSTKASKHKEVYPYIRYGLVIGEKDKLDRRFFTHNSGFDFAFAMSDIDSDFKELVETVKKQLRAAELMLDVMQTKEVRKFLSNIELA